jgi:hypothetical protein
METLTMNQMESLSGGITRAERNAGCAAYGIAAGIASGMNPLVAGLTTAGCMLTTSYDE